MAAPERAVPDLDVALLYATPPHAEHGEEGFVTIRLEHLQRVIRALREAALEAEIGFEISGHRVVVLQRHDLTDRADPAFGPVLWPGQGPRPGAEPEF